MKKITALFLATLFLISSCQKADEIVVTEEEIQPEIEQSLDDNQTETNDHDIQSYTGTSHVEFFTIDGKVIACNASSGRTYEVKNPSDILILSSIKPGVLYSTEALITSDKYVEFVVGTEFIDLNSEVFKTLKEAENHSLSCLDYSLYTSNEISLSDYKITSTTSNTDGNSEQYTYLATGTPTNHSLLANNNNEYENSSKTLELVANATIQKVGDYFIVLSEPTFINLYKTASFEDNVLLYAEGYFRYYTNHTLEKGTMTGEHIYAMSDIADHTIAKPSTASFFLEYHQEKIFLQSIDLADDSYNSHNKLQYIDTSTKNLVDLQILATPIAIKDTILYYISDENELCTLNLSTLEIVKISEKLSEHQHSWSGYIIDGELNVIGREPNINSIDLHQTFSV